MGTSLAEQLQKLAVPQTNLLVDSKKKASLLFEPKEAATLRKDTIYNIGLEGLEDLISKSLVFEEFKETLFHVTSKNFERSITNKDGNSKVDNAIRKFLLMVSPYFMLSSSHKALEWLIHRYMIHEYNREDILILILPYHETNIFVRMVQLLKFKDHNDSFYFLKQLQKPGVHLTKQNLLNHAASNNGFLKFVTKMINNLIDVHPNPHTLTIAFNFYCSVFSGVIEYSTEISEDQISQILPLILKGLSSSIPDFSAATYIIVARLLSKTSLKDKVLDKFMKKITEIDNTNFKVEIILVILVIYQSQADYKNLPLDVIENITRIEWFSQCLQYLNSNGNYIYPFLKVAIRKISEAGLQDANKSARDLMVNILDEIKMDDFFVKIFLCEFLGVLNPDQKYGTEVDQWLHEIIHKLDKQYPTSFDAAVSEIFKSGSPNYNKNHSTCLKNILQNAMMFEGKFEILNKLYHPSLELRQESLSFLTNHFSNFRQSEQDFIKHSLYDKLNDENPKVVKETLMLLQQTEVVHKDFYDNVLLYVINSKQFLSDKWKNVFVLAINLLTKTRTFDWKLFLSISPVLILPPGNNFKELKQIFKSKFFSNYILFNEFCSNLKYINNSTEMYNQFIACFENNDNSEIVESLLQSIDLQLENSINHYYSIIFLLSKLVPNSCTIKTAFSVLQIFERFYTKYDEERNKGAERLKEYSKIKLLDKFPLEDFVKCTENIVKKVTLNKDSIIHIDFSEDTELAKFIKLLFTQIFKDTFPSKIRSDTINYIFSEPYEITNLLLNVASSKVVSDSYILKILDFIRHALNNAQLNVFDINTLAYLLTLLVHSKAEIRKSTLTLIKLLINKQKCLKDAQKFGYLCEGLISHFDEIFVDPEQVSLIAYNLLVTGYEAKKISDEVKLCLSDLVHFACDLKSPVYAKAGVLIILSHINTFEITEKLCESGFTLFMKTAVIQDHYAVVSETIINRLDPLIASKINLETSIYKFINFALRHDKKVIIADQETCLPVILLNQLTREVYSRLPNDVLEKLLDTICEILTYNQHPEVHSLSNRLFKHLDLDAKMIVSILQNMKDVESSKLVSTKKRRRVNVVPTVDILDTLEWKKGVCMLELIQDKKKIRNSQCLTPLLFSILKKCLDFEEQSAVEYPKQLILSLILLVCSKSENENLPENVFNIELVIQCIRASQNPQTHHHALLVLVEAAQIVPTDVLHHIMSIFTFMGSSLLRYDDAYSFQIIIKIIDAIIPILLTKKDTASIANVLQVFVDALSDVPEHRRLPVYKQLLTKVNELENLYIFLLLVFEKEIMSGSQEKQKNNKDQQTTLDIALHLCLEFSPEVILNVCLQLINYLKSLPDEKDDKIDLKVIGPISNIRNYTPKQFRHFKYVLINFIKNILTDILLINKIVVLSQNESVSLEKLYKDLIVSILTYIQRIQKVTEKAANTPQAQYWKIMLHHSYDILDSINALLTPHMFLLVIKGLTLYNIYTVKRRALELLNAKLQHNFQYFDECDRSEIYILIPPIISIIETLNSEEVESDQEVLIQTALLSLKLIVKAFASDDPEKFVQILEFISNLLNSGKPQNNVLASVILCLAELCAILRVHAISCLPDVMPAFLKILKKQKHQDTSSLLLISVVTAVNKLLDSLSLFLSPYLKKIIFEMSILISKWSCSNKDQKATPLVNKLNLVAKKLGSLIPARVLIPSIEDSYNTCITKKYFKAIGSLMDILSECIKHLTPADLNSSTQDLTNFFLHALKFRSEKSQSIEDANNVETHIVKALTVFILKLSESSFKPFYYKIYDWAIRGDEKSERLITFYNLSMNIAQSLKGLFVLFASHFLNNAAQIVSDINKLKGDNTYFKDEAKDIMLLEYVLKTLQTVFRYANQKFINRDRFDILMQPLVDQLENDIGGIEILNQRNETLLTPTIVHLFVAVSDDVCWKQINYQILLKMRSATPGIRLIALHCLKEVVTKLGQDFLPLLPETIPFLAELLEDEEETVEKACQKAIREIEVVLGEPLQKYF
ncbi:HEAT repeat-containing protein 1 [Sitophilus oryzae]|uniref:HEAT repeat-containing protein 1 n=1 Tax=Sitophilus oryzae TaxID=7048 RepID=A0A6J2Y066_SITOR|nr:HEAT repeat-containing protein 1 [Sitophilus oryzae]